MIEVVHGKGGVLGGDGFEAHLFREELTDEAVHVFVGAAFPGGIGMSEVEVGAERLGNPFMLSELLAVIGRQRMNAGRKGRQQGNHRVRDGLRGLARDMGDQGIARLALVERNECLPMVRADDQITFPVAETFAAIDDGRTLLNRHLIGNGAAPLANPVALPTRFLAAQRTVQSAAAALVGVDALVDAFMADGGLSVRLEVAGDLFRAPCLGKLGIDKGPCVVGNPGQARMRACENS